MRTYLTAIHRVVDHPWTNLAVAAALIGTSLSEMGESVLEPIMSGDIQAHHGVFVFGIAQLLKSIPEIVDGLERGFHGPETDLDGGE